MKKIIISALMAFSIVSLADFSTTDIGPSDKTIAPHEQVNIPVSSPLQSGKSYVVLCKIDNSNKDIVLLRTNVKGQTWGDYGVIMDFMPTYKTNVDLVLPPIPHQIWVGMIADSSNMLSFTNLDDKNSLLLKNCVASQKP